MGVSCEANGQSIDPVVGGLVWVCRRNGSWWPARILGHDELPESCLVSTRRSGTPVKLLGREDASVDWYNLEKSKRVKAFRCGEYDECIERAKVTASINCGKVSKYARREDAILHALEIENSQLSKNNNLEHISDKSSGLDFISVSPQEQSRTAASPDDSLEGMRQETQNESEDDEIEGSKKRMRGLQDLGVGREVSSFKKKRTQVAHIHDFLKKKSRRCQLTKVMKRTEMVTIPVMCEGLTDLDGSGFPDAKMWEMGYNEVKGSFSDSMGDAANKQKEYENSSVSELLETDDSSGRLFDVPFIKEEKQTAGSSPSLEEPKTVLVGTQPQAGQSSPIETVSVVPEEFQESGYISSGVDISHIIDNNGSSKWQHKGKRKSRNKSKTKPIMSFLTPDDESREVNKTVEVTAPQKNTFINQPCSTGSLYDINIEVKSDNFPRHIPYISFLSNFTGQRVTGHSVEVDVVNDAVSDLSFNSSESLSGSCDLGSVNADVEMVPVASRKVRKNGLLSNKKTRKLSSLTGSKTPSETETLKRPDLACVMLEVVFGRINAALGITSDDVGPTR